MGQPMDYDDYAARYAQTRAAVPWVIQPLLQAIRRLPAPATILEIGCGTGNYLTELAQVLPEYRYSGFDLSAGMLAQARARTAAVEWLQGNAEERFPYPDRHGTLAFTVDVIHHLVHLDRFFQEAARVLVPGGRCLVVTDSECNLRTRSLTAFFPEILEIELSRYPTMDELHVQAQAAGLAYLGLEAAEGWMPIDEAFMVRLEAKCSSGMRLMPDAAHRQGMARVRQAHTQGERWYSCYSIVHYGKRDVTRTAS